MRSFAFAAGILAILLGAPLAAASSQSAYFSTTPGPLNGTFLLNTTAPESDGSMNMLGGQNVTWARDTTLATGAVANGSSFSYTLYFAEVSGFVNVTYGYFDAEGEFTGIGSKSSQILRDLDVDVGLTRGKVETSLTLTRDLPADARIAIQLRTSTNNALYIQHSTLLSEPVQSQATVPLPELPALVLMGLGVATVGAVAFTRRRAP